MATTGGSHIADFYKGRSILITGATGFMGKVSHQKLLKNARRQYWYFSAFLQAQVLVEKLLRSCPDVKNLYLLMRPKRGQDVRTRLTELLNAQVNINSLFTTFLSNHLLG
jgi:alcohol-forming fatty acyl-CoA reductase